MSYDAESQGHEVLLIALDVAVPLWLHELARMTPDMREENRLTWARRSASVIAARGDQLMYRTPRRYPTTGSCARCGRPVSRLTRQMSVWVHAETGVANCDPDHLDARLRKTVVPDGATAIPDDDGGGTADAFNYLAAGLAALAHQPGGVTFAGRHWCTDHAACEAALEIANEQIAHWVETRTP